MKVGLGWGEGGGGEYLEMGLNRPCLVFLEPVFPALFKFIGFIALKSNPRVSFGFFSFFFLFWMRGRGEYFELGFPAYP